jgi:polar amino acid transport system substrate-binding protein
MVREKKILVMIVAIALMGLAVSLSGCVEEKKDENKIIVGTSADFPPFEFIDESGKITGFDIEVITTILENLNYTVEVKDIAFDSLIPSLQSDKIDIIAAGMTITEDRDEVIDFSNPYYNADQSVLIKKDSGVEINSSHDLENFTQSIATLKIGAQTGTTGAGWVQENLIDTELMAEENLKLYDLYIDAIADLDIGTERLDAIVLDLQVAKAFAEGENREVAYTIITGENYGFGVKEGSTEFLNKFNTELAKFIDSEDWNNLIKKYFE